MSQLATDLQRLVQYYSSGRTERATKTARTLVRRYPNQPLPHNILGVMASNRSDHTSAVKHFRRALDLEPAYPDALNNLGASLRQLGQLPEAEQCYRRVLQLTPDDPDVHFNLGNVLKDGNRPADAADQYRTSIALRPDFAPAHVELANLLLLERESNLAMQHFQQALEMAPDSPEALYGIGRVLQQRRRHQEALNWFREALDVAPDNPAAVFESARSLLQLERLEEAAALFERHLELVPNHPSSLHFLAAARGQTPPSAPSEYVAALFDDYASSFEQHLVKDLGYGGPGELADLLAQHDGNDRHYPRMLDLGCGSGLAAVAFGDRCEHLTGVDISPRMIEVARDKGRYDELVTGDIVEAAAALVGHYNLIICADTLVYLGTLEPFATAVAARAAPGARLLLSTEPGADGDVQLLLSGRYAHGRDYVTRTLEAAGFQLVDVRRKPLRKEGQHWLDGEFFLFEAAGR